MENPLGLSWKAEWGLKMQGSQPKTPSSQRHYFYTRFFFLKSELQQKIMFKKQRNVKDGISVAGLLYLRLQMIQHGTSEKAT